MRKTRPVSLAAAALATTLALTACSSSKHTSAPGTTAATAGSASPSTAAAPTGSPIKIGFAVAEQGSEGVIGKKSSYVAMAWQDWVNANGGIAGHPVQVIIKDSAGDPATMVSDVQEFVNSDHVAAVMTNDDTAEPAAGQFLSSNNIPVIGATGFTTTLWSAKPNYYTMVTQIPFTLLGQAIVGKAAGVKKMGVVVCAEVAACAQAEQLFKPATTALGLTFTGQETASASSPNYAAQCLALTQKGTDFISLALATAVNVRFIKDCNQQGFTGYYGVDANAFDQAQQGSIPNTKILGNLQSFPWWSSAQPVVQFRNAMAKYQPSADYRNSESTSVWSALELFRAALANVGSGDVTPAVVTQAYDNVKNETLGGLLPQPVTFTAGKAAPTINCQWLFTFKSGDKNPTILQQGQSGNGASGDLSSSCASPSLMGG